ncbi:MAG TPA: hypothetical protein VNN19_01325 [bacterium]|nr:hypothetical protein [bacterium]
MAERLGSGKDTIPPRVLLEFEAPDHWVYLYVDDSGETRLVSQDEWEAFFRPAPEDQS